MRPIHFAEANADYGKPKNMTDEECYPLSAYQHIENGFITRIVTVWQPNKEDIEAINAGRPIVVSVSGGSLPPMALFTLDENGNSND